MKISGKVIKGKARGRELGFPTANVELKEDIASGIYGGSVIVEGKEYAAAIFVFQNLLEAYLFNFNQDIYGMEIRIELGQKIRDVMKFESEEKLKEQIAKDIKKISNLKF